MDPITAALAAGASAGPTTVAAQAVMDAYVRLKTALSTRFPQLGVHVQALEARPASKSRQSLLAEELVEVGAQGDGELLQLAQALLDAIRQEAPEAAVRAGVDLEGVLAGGSMEIEDAEGDEVGVRGRDWDVKGDVRIHGVRGGGGPDPDSVRSAHAAQPPVNPGVERPLADLRNVSPGRDFIFAGGNVVLPPDPGATIPPSAIEHQAGPELRFAKGSFLWTRRGALIAALGVAVAIIAIVLAIHQGSTSQQAGPVGIVVNTVPQDPIGGAAIYTVPGGQPSDFVTAGQSLYIDCLQPLRPNYLLARISDGPYRNHWIDAFDVKTPRGEDVRFLTPPLPSCGAPVTSVSGATGSP